MADSSTDKTLLNKVADALMSAHLAQARERLSKHEFPFERIEKAFEVACAEADRSTSILLFAVAEDLMLECFKANMNPSVRGGWNAVAEGNGVLATASDRIDLLELLYWTKPNTCKDLRLMKAIRNRFAHHSEVHSFEDIKVASWIASMSHHEKVVESLAPKRDVKTTLRDVFLMRAISTLVGLATDLAVGPISTQERLNPRSLTQGGFDNLPENMKEAMRTQSRLMLAVYLQVGDLGQDA